MKMERDFMGLTSKEPLSAAVPVVKEEDEINHDSSKDSGFSKGCGAQWLFSNNKVSAIPHLMSFKVSQDAAFDSTHKRSAPEPQKPFNHDGQGGFHFSLTPYHVQHDVNSVNRPHDVKMFSVPNQAISVPTAGSLFLKNNFATAGQNLNGAMLGGVPVTVPHSNLPTISAAAGMPESCNVKPSAPSAKLTIFYAGTVSVFEDISAAKAQAIMLLAGTGISAASNMAQPKVHAASDGVPVSQPANTPPCSGLPSPLSVSSHTGAQSGSGSTSTDEFMVAKTTGVPATPVRNNVEPPKVVSATAMLASAVPQARKASLARFLEKRKERVMSAAPYNLNKKSEECATAECNGANFSAATNLLSVKQG